MNAMAQAHKGYFQAGRFISTEDVKIPDFLEVYVVVTDNKTMPIKTKAQAQRQALDEFVQTIANTDPLGEEFDEVIKQGVRFQGEVNL